MNRLLKTTPFVVLALVLTAALSCIQPAPSSPPAASPTASPTVTTLPAPSKNEAVLLFGIGVHIEPLGATVSPLVGKTEPSPGPGGTTRPDYHQRLLFDRHVQDIKALAAIVERHGGKLTVQAQTPFTEIAIQSKEPILADLAKKGHELGLHFHENVHLGNNCESLSPETWTAVMTAEINFIKQAGAKPVRYWSGGNLYPGLLKAAAMAGLEVMSDWKNPITQLTERPLIGLNPWRPAAGPNGADVSGFAQHDPQGKIIFLPEGNYTRPDFASMRRSPTMGGDAAYFDYLKDELQRSVAAVRPGMVNVFHFTVHPGEFRGSVSEPFAVIDRFLTDAVDLLVKAGKVRWATFSEMADSYKAWEQANPGVNPRQGSNMPPPPAGQPQPPPFNPSRLGKVEKDVTYGIAEGVALKMDIYYPLSATGAVPALAYVHGGGWIGGDKALGAGTYDVAELVSRGYLVAAINYRLAPQYKFPAQIEDVKCAIRFLRAKAATYGIDPARIGVWGGSAGGHLVALLGTTDSSAGLEGSSGFDEQSSRVQAVVDMFGPADLAVTFEGNKSDLLQRVFGTNDHKSDIVKRASPVTYVTADDPPFLILHGDKDALVPLSQSQILYDRLIATGVPATLVIVKNAGHGFVPTGGTPSPSRAELARMMADFFDKHLK